MKKKLITVQKILCMIETKGTNTCLMADSLRLLEQCISECEEPRPEEESKPEYESEKEAESVD